MLGYVIIIIRFIGSYTNRYILVRHHEKGPDTKSGDERRSGDDYGDDILHGCVS